MIGLEMLGLEDEARALLDRGSHGWSLEVKPEPVRDRAAARRCVTRAGRMLAIFEALGTTDMHRGNVIPRGERLVPIDLETIMPPPLSADDSGLEVLATGLLPGWFLGEESRRTSFDGALTGYGPNRRFHRRLPAWREDAAGVPCLRLEAPAVPGDSCLPRRGDGRLCIFEHVDSFLEGYRSAVPFAASRAWRPLRGMRCRRILRETLTYELSFLAACAPESLRSGKHFHGALRRLLRSAVPGRALPAAVIASEIRQMARGDIPVFTGTTTGRVLEGADGTIVRGLVPRSALDGLRRRARRFSEDGVAMTCALVRATLEMAARPAFSLRLPDHPGAWLELVPLGEDLYRLVPAVRRRPRFGRIRHAAR